MPPQIAEFFEAQVKDKLPAASIFARTGGEAWNKDAWKYPIKDAVAAAGLPGAASAYTLRHSVITDLILPPQCPVWPFKSRRHLQAV